MIKTGIGLAFFYFLFKLLLSRDGRHAYKRLVLLLSVGASFTIPLLANMIPGSEIDSTPMIMVREFIELPLVETGVNDSTSLETTDKISHTHQVNWYVLIYQLVLILLFLRFLLSYKSIFKWLKQANIQVYKNLLLAIVKDNIQAFSFWKYIVLSKQDYQNNKTPILLHEEAHLRMHHSYDVILMELVCFLQWFNPFAWLLKKELKLVHEFQADQAVLKSGIDATQYQLLILEKAVGKRRFASANHFKQGSISKRIKMMKKKQFLRWSVAKTLLFLPAGFLLLQAFANPKVSEKVNTLPALMVQANDSESWLKEWRYENIENLNAGIFYGKQPAHKADLSWKLGPIKKRNVLAVLQNKRGALLVNGKLVSKTELKTIVISFIRGKDYWNESNPETAESKLSNGKSAKVNQLAISYQIDRGTPKDDVANSMQAFGKAYLEVRSEKAQELFGKDYFQLSDAQQLEINERVPIRIAPFTAIKNSANSVDIRITTEGIFIDQKKCALSLIEERIKALVQNKNRSLAEIRVLDPKTNKETIEEIKRQVRNAGIKRINYSGVMSVVETPAK
ncbi:M56 family metallopeptidase [Marinifilum fragile]|uniref:M56 family metallopeptidase n=1 Tax=Marinifilum fragile TaxID=570161 RepID=UPI002AA75ACB|nr:M56 family metallopeptidase [Marinifilum fragile]